MSNVELAPPPGTVSRNRSTSLESTVAAEVTAAILMVTADKLVTPNRIQSMSCGLSIVSVSRNEPPGSVTARPRASAASQKSSSSCASRGTVGSLVTYPSKTARPYRPGCEYNARACSRPGGMPCKATIVDSGWVSAGSNAKPLQSWTLGPGSHDCKGFAFEPAAAQPESTIV